MNDAVIIGAGPSGLAAAYEIVRCGGSLTVVDKLDRVGGLSRTIPHAGSRFDIGPHRFFTTNEEVRKLFLDVVAEDTLRVSRLTRIYFRNRFFNYPLTPINALAGVGFTDAAAILGSYAARRASRAWRPREPENFEEWVADHFGTKLFQMFFKNYTEKVWGIPCTQIGAEWAAQRIKGLDLLEAVRHAVFKSGSGKIKTLVDEFMFPRLGAGQFYEKMADSIMRQGATILANTEARGYLREGHEVQGVVVRNVDGQENILEGRFYLSSAPLTEMVLKMDPPPPDAVLAACRDLRYRHHIGVHLRVRGHPFPDNWIYVHSKEFKMARIANYRNFSRVMADSDQISPLTVEYFAFPGDDIWRQSDAELTDLAATELHKMKLINPDSIASAFVVRSENAYPVIEMGSQDKIKIIRTWLEQFKNLRPIGRGGMFKYNNQDHAIATGLLAARDLLELGRYDPWLVNIDAEYQEAAAVR